MKKLLLTMTLLLTSFSTFADGKSRCAELNKALPGVHKISLDDGGDVIKFIYSIKKIKNFEFMVTMIDENGETLRQASMMKLEVKKNGRCYFYNPLVTDSKNHMKAGPIYLKPFTLGRKILEAEFSNEEGFYMVIKEI